MIHAQIVGATGYGGLGMTELLLRHPEFRIQSLLASSDVGKPISHFFPHLRGFCDMVVHDAKDAEIGKDVDVVICSTPDRVAMAIAPRALEAGARLLDYSGDFRFRSVADYDRYAGFHPSTGGKPHTSPELLPRSVYGIPELFRGEIEGARLVGNPGCFAVAMILGLAPALKEHIIEPGSIVVDGKTGSSGAGKKLRAEQHFSQYDENLTAYRAGNHQHVVESVMALERVGGARVGITFVPHLVPLTRGIVCTCYATLSEDLPLSGVHELYDAFYANEPFVRVQPLGLVPGVKAVAGSNLCDISLALDAPNGRLIAVAAIDNLMKGQAGSALQNLNAMFGLPETMGLERMPLYP